MAGFHVLIPARFDASRLPGKPLQDVGGRALILRVMDQAAASGAQRVVVATDDQRVVDAVIADGGEAVLTSPTCSSGSDRLAEAAAQLGLDDEGVVVNVQGDEPFIAPELIHQVAQALLDEPALGMATAAHTLTRWEELFDPNVVKVVRNQAGHALYFSRAPIPWLREPLGHSFPEDGPPTEEVPPGLLVHVGLYAYRRSFLERYTRWAPTALEELEALEQLRVLEHGEAIRVIESEHPVGLGVDTPADLEKARHRLGHTD
jgi:3-deoxy-manno-octulosonate cytidylyltransferase (CMP-KDO synthetase)